jgi:hypothetical protein
MSENNVAFQLRAIGQQHELLLSRMYKDLKNEVSSKK